MGRRSSKCRRRVAILNVCELIGGRSGETWRASLPGPASSEYVPEDLPKRRTKLLNKADWKNRESENPEEVSLLSGRNPHGCARTPEGALRNRESTERGRGGTSVCEYGRNDKTPKGCPTGSGVNGRPPKLADWNLAPHMILSPEPFSVRQS